MIRFLILPALLGVPFLASCGPPYPDERPWGPPPLPPWMESDRADDRRRAEADDRRRAGVDALRGDRWREDDSYQFERGPRDRSPDDRRFGGRQAVPDNPPPTRDAYPVAERTADPNQVISPYEPYNVIDVEGFRTGQLARDPSNQKIFRIP